MAHRSWLAPGAALLSIFTTSGCATAPSTAPPEAPGEERASGVEAEKPAAPAEPAPLAPTLARAEERPRSSVLRGFGAVTARVPGTRETVSGVRLLSHHVAVVVRDRFARTEIVEELANDTSRVLEGRFAFPVPPAASLSRLALWVGDDLVEGEIVERERATTIFDSIADDSVRPRDPALLEWVKGSELSLRIFPLPAHGTRKVVLAYEEALRVVEGRARYVYPLSLGPDRSARVGDFSLRIDVDRGEDAAVSGYPATITPSGHGLGVTFGAQGFAPPGDFVLTWDDIVAPAEPAEAAAARERFVAVRVPVEAPAVTTGHPGRRDHAVILDVSHSQSPETLADETVLAAGLVGRLAPEERFVLLACDSACISFPEDGLTPASPAALDEARAWLSRRAPGGSSDLAGALVAAARRLDPGGTGRIVYLGDGAPTSGELGAETIAARVGPELAARDVDLTLVGAGRTVDAVVLEGIARAVGGAYERQPPGESQQSRVEALVQAMRAPALRRASLEVPAGLADVYPRVLPALRVGQELLIVGRLAAGEAGEVKLRGELDGAPVELSASIAASDASAGPAERIWAESRIAELEASADPAAAREVVALSRRHHVLSRRTALLVLENDRMFAQFGIERTRHPERTDEPISGGGLPGPARSAFGTASHGAFRPGLASFSSVDAVGVGGLPAGFEEGLATSHVHKGGGFVSPLGAVSSGGRAEAGDAIASVLPGARVADAPRAPEVRVSAATAGTSSLGAAGVTRVVQARMPRLRSCYQGGLARSPALEGRVVARLVIGPDGWVQSATDAGSSLPDPAVVGCVLSTFRSLLFPRSDAGVVTAVVPVQLTSIAAPPRRSPSAGDPRPAVLQAGDDAWMTAGDDALEKLRRAAADDGASRRRHEALVRGLLVHGRFSEALAAARRFAELDPESSRAHELLAGAAAAAAEPHDARTALDAQVELNPRSAALHGRAARAFEAAGDEVRACAHWRSLAELRPGADAPRSQALRCRARLGERDAVLRDAAAIDRPGKQVAALLAALQAGPAPAYDPAAASPGEMEVSVRCSPDTAGCPDVVVVKPTGDVVSPWSPAAARSSARSVAFAGLSGTGYRAVLVGGSPDARGEVEVRARDARRTFRFAPGSARTVATATVIDLGPW